jgi:hypothetical protein
LFNYFFYDPQFFWNEAQPCTIQTRHPTSQVCARWLGCSVVPQVGPWGACRWTLGCMRAYSRAWPWPLHRASWPGFFFASEIYTRAIVKCSV